MTIILHALREGDEHPTRVVLSCGFVVSDISANHRVPGRLSTSWDWYPYRDGARAMVTIPGLNEPMYVVEDVDTIANMMDARSAL